MRPLAVVSDVVSDVVFDVAFDEPASEPPPRVEQAPEPHRSDIHPTLTRSTNGILKEVGEPLGCFRTLFIAV